MINFSNDVKQSLAGKVNGFFEFVGLRDYLEITFDSAPVQEVHTVDLGSTSAVGTYRYAFENGVISDQELSFDADASAIQSAIDALPQLVERNITTTVNDGIDVTTSQTVTFSSNAGKVSHDLGKITILGNGITGKVNGTTVSTVGQKGWNSGSDYTVEIHMYKFKCLEVAKNGKLTCKDL